MRSFHSVASTRNDVGWVSAPCLTLRVLPALRFAPVVVLAPPPSYLPSLGAALLSALLAALRRCGTMKALTPAQLTHRAGLPAYCATPSCRSISTTGLPGHRFSHHASVTSDFRASLMESQARRSFPRIEFVILA